MNSDPGGAATGARSYDFARLDDQYQRQELARLQAQANQGVHLELPHLQRAGIGQARHILDLGCGPGFVAGALANQFPAAHILGLDHSPELLALGKKIVAPAHPNLDFQQGDAYATGLASGSFDFVFCRFVLQHLPDPLAALREAKRLTRPGGHVYISDVDDTLILVDPAPAAMDRLMLLSAARQKARGGDRFVGRRLPRLLAQAGLQQVSATVQNITSLELGWDAFFHIAFWFRAELAGEEGPRLLEEMHAALSGLSAPPFGSVGFFVTTGVVAAE